MVTIPAIFAPQREIGSKKSCNLRGSEYAAKGHRGWVKSRQRGLRLETMRLPRKTIRAGRPMTRKRSVDGSGTSLVLTPSMTRVYVPPSGNSSGVLTPVNAFEMV